MRFGQVSVCMASGLKRSLFPSACNMPYVGTAFPLISEIKRQELINPEYVGVVATNVLLNPKPL